uniref:Armadillo-like repeats domain-containing protein n=1 Tax=Nelumbo nucifera TaxID=4432 RepID=A0A822XKT8_NELNU|nr:TPA_asm: hypothetical protein HUJ06_022433 [Nelumbo nucifera]
MACCSQLLGASSASTTTNLRFRAPPKSGLFIFPKPSSLYVPNHEHRCRTSLQVSTMAKKRSEEASVQQQANSRTEKPVEEEEEVEEDLPWIQEKAMDLVDSGEELVADLIQLRKAPMLDDAQVAEILNEISRRIVREKGPVVMDMSGYSEKGLKRKLVVQALFGKIFYLSELPEFCSRDSSLIVKEIFGVTDEDLDTLRIHTFSDDGDVDSIQKMVNGPESGESSDDSSNVFTRLIM